MWQAGIMIHHEPSFFNDHQVTLVVICGTGNSRLLMATQSAFPLPYSNPISWPSLKESLIVKRR